MEPTGVVDLVDEPGNDQPDLGGPPSMRDFGRFNRPVVTIEA